jgi:Carboxypeptidase regulatory-like domain
MTSSCLGLWKRQLRLVLAGGVLLSLGFAAALAAQLQGGSLHGTITDPDGKPLVGVRVELQGQGAELEAATDAKGHVRWIGLAPGVYKLRAQAPGFAPAEYDSIGIQGGRSTALQVQMSLVPGEAITVTADPPQENGRAFATSLRLSREELDSIPTTRDPAAIAAQAPGVLLAGVNSGGSESGQQLLLLGGGSSVPENTFAVDGVVVTDMAAAGSSPAYYDFNQYDEIRVSTGGSDPRVQNSGVTFSLMTRRSTDRWRAGGRLLWTDGAWQADARANRRDLAPGQPPVSLGRIAEIREFGADAGGPIVRERLWAWGSVARADVHRFSSSDLPVEIRLENRAAKFQGQFGAADSTVALYQWSEKIWDGRGASPVRAPETTWRQAGPLQLGKLEHTHLFRGTAQATAMVSAVETDFSLLPKGGLAGEPLLDRNGVYRGTFATVELKRDTRQWRVDGSGTKTIGDFDHVFAAGAGSRRFLGSSSERWGNRQLINVAPEFYDGEHPLVEAVRYVPMGVVLDYDEVWLQDTIRGRRFTLNLGFRYDGQRGQEEAVRVAPHPVFPEVLPGFDYDGGPVLQWKSVSPRLAFSYLLGKERRTTLRFGYSQFAGQLRTAILDRTSPLYAAADFAFDDEDGDGIYDSGEAATFVGLFAGTPDRTARGLRPESTDALDIGVERAFAGGFQAGLYLTHRQVDDVLESRLLVLDPETGAERAALRTDFRLFRIETVRVPGGPEREVEVYGLVSGLKPTGGYLLVNGDRRQVYDAVTLQFSRATGGRFQLRGQVTVSDWRWQIGPEFGYYDDPTDAAPGSRWDGTDTADGDGEPVAQQALPGGDKDGLFLNSRWSFSLTGLVQVAPQRPWGFSLAAAVSGREGFPEPYSVRVFAGDGVRRDVQATSRGDSMRYEDLYLVDLRVEKQLAIGDAHVTFGVDVFNALNARTPLQRARSLNSRQAGYLLDAVGPRVLRLGVRLGWR